MKTKPLAKESSTMHLPVHHSALPPLSVFPLPPLHLVAGRLMLTLSSGGKGKCVQTAGAIVRIRKPAQKIRAGHAS